ncbi:MAG: helix-turn-helix domain-containing protein [Armatimonadetes bacterium]|nr:helix-turn-helix domain-containing protein [Armatimonadota bacterium]
MADRRAADNSPRWLSLGEASRMLGVDQSTLRQWADRGQVPVFRTPGGHRRFSEVEIRALLAGRASWKATRPAEVVQRGSTGYLAGPEGKWLASRPWFGAFDEPARRTARDRCRGLMGALVGFLAGGRRGRKYAETGRRHGSALGREVARLGLSPAHLTEAFLFFRRMIVESLTRPSVRRALPAEGQVHSLKLVDEFFDQVQMAMMDAYAQARRQ